jgi:DNA-binding response OmpR family regulator
MEERPRVWLHDNTDELAGRGLARSVWLHVETCPSAYPSRSHLEIDLAAHTVRRDREEIHLTPTEFDLLRVLVRNRGPAAEPTARC